jgi:hypothetical protein
MAGLDVAADHALGWTEPKKRDDAIRRYVRWVERRRLDLPSAEWDDDDPENPAPIEPGGLGFTLWWNVEPMRPDEFLTQRAMRWTQASVDQRIKREVIDDVAQEASGYRRLDTDQIGEVG